MLDWQNKVKNIKKVYFAIILIFEIEKLNAVLIRKVF
jgi:hypothetical protein